LIGKEIAEENDHDGTSGGIKEFPEIL